MVDYTSVCKEKGEIWKLLSPNLVSPFLCRYKRVHAWVVWRFCGSRDYPLFTKATGRKCMQEFEMSVPHLLQRISITSISVKMFLTAVYLIHLVQFLHRIKLQHTQQMKSRIYLRRIRKCACKTSLFVFSFSKSLEILIP